MGGKPRIKGFTSSLSAEHYTPASHVEAIREVLGEIDLDPCSGVVANQTVKAKRIYTFLEDGSTGAWFGNVYCNPPGDRRGVLIRRFWLRAVEHAFDGGAVLWAGFASGAFFRLGTFVVDGRRLPGPSEWPFVPVLYGPGTTGSGRIKWIDGKTLQPGRSPAHHNFYCLLGGDAAMRARFREVFSIFGPVTTPAALPRKPRPLAEMAVNMFRGGGPWTKTELAGILRIRQQTACRLVDSLVEQGLLERRGYTYHLVRTRLVN